jgi:hypothetical protein
MAVEQSSISRIHEDSQVVKVMMAHDGVGIWGIGRKKLILTPHWAVQATRPKVIAMWYPLQTLPHLI